MPGHYRRPVQLIAADNGQAVLETGAPTRCPASHQLGAGTMLVGYDSPDPAREPRVRTVQCRACMAVWFDGFGWR